MKDLPGRGAGTLITDGDGGNLSFRTERVRVSADQQIVVTMRGRGGFVITFD